MLTYALTFSNQRFKQAQQPQPQPPPPPQRRLVWTRVSKVKGHADEEMVASGQVRALDKVGNDQADDAADHGRRRVTGSVIDARRHLGCVWSLVFCCSQFASVLHCHREGCS